MISKKAQEFIHKSITESPEYVAIKNEFIDNHYIGVSRAADIIENTIGWRSEVYACAILQHIVYSDNGKNDLHIFTNC